MFTVRSESDYEEVHRVSLCICLSFSISPFLPAFIPLYLPLPPYQSLSLPLALALPLCCVCASGCVRVFVCLGNR